MEFSDVCILVLLVFVVFLVLRMKLSLLLVLGYSLLLVQIGLVILASRYGASWEAARNYAAGVGALALGFVVAARAYQPVRAHPTRSSVFSDASVTLIAVVAGTLALYHLFAGGIPLFSTSIEIERFDFTSSGFFGIPGRMFLYGVPLAWMIASVNATRLATRWRDYKPWLLATALYVATAILSGFKSGLLAMAITMLITYLILVLERPTVGAFARKYLWVLAVPVIYAISVATTYSTYVTSGLPLWEQLLNRLTVVGAQPVQYALEGRTRTVVPNGLINDLMYFAPKYSGQDVSGQFSLERAVSAEIIGVSPGSSSWTTPVTIGGIAELQYSLGLPLAMVILAVVGAGLALVSRHSFRTAPGLVAALVGTYATYNWLIKGGLVYYALNVLAVAVMLLIVGTCAQLFSRTSSAHPGVVMTR